MWYTLSVIFCFITISSSNGSQIPHGSSIVNELIHTIQLEHWSIEEKICLDTTQAILENLKNFTLWATWIWNANTLPSGNLYGSWAQYGNFEQCMNPPWLATHPQFKTQHCLTNIKLTDKPNNLADFDPYGSTEKFMNVPTKMGMPMNQVIWGLCLPASCGPLSIAKIAKVLYQKFSFGHISPNVTVLSCQEAGMKQEYTTGFYLFMVLMASLLIMALVSTYYQSHVSSHNQSPHSLKTIITKSFCMVRNQQNLMKEYKEEMKVMNGIRFITTGILVLMHVVVIHILFGISNIRKLEKYLEGIQGILFHTDITVDTFFAMSGLLHIKGLLAPAKKQTNLFGVLWQRYVRLVGPLAVTIFYLISVSKCTGSGAFWPIGNNLETVTCHKTWRASLLMLNNNIKDVCNLVTWYIACDYQLTILGTVIFYVYQKDKKRGLVAFGTATFFSVVIPAAVTYTYGLPALHWIDFSKFMFYNIRDYWEVSYTYMASYSRAGSYLVGVAMGYFMSLYRPAQYRNTVSKTWSIIGTAAALTVMIGMLSLGQFYLGREYNPIEVAIVMPTNRIVWAAAVCCIVALCEYGTVPIVSDILGKSFFTPLSRLSYGIYLTHLLIVERSTFVLNSAATYDIFNIVITSLGTLAFSIALSFVMWLLVDAPAYNLCNHFFFTGSNSKEFNTNTGNNGIEYENGLDLRNGHDKRKTL